MLKKNLIKNGDRLPSRAVTPMSQGYYPETDLFPEVDQDGITIFQEFIGILRWAVKIVRVDILTDISMLSSVSKKRSHQTDTSHLLIPQEEVQAHVLLWSPRTEHIPVVVK